MEIYSNVLTCVDVYNAVMFAQDRGQDIYTELVREHASRKAALGITVYCESQDGKRNRNGRDGKAATWDAYGYMMAYLYNIDPYALIGQYTSVRDFRVKCELSSRYSRDRTRTAAFLDHLTVAP